MSENYGEFFEKFKKELLEAFELEKAKLIASSFDDLSGYESWMVRDSIYDYSDWTDVLYKEMLSRFSRISLDKTRDMIVAICLLKGFESEKKRLKIPSFGGNTITFPIFIDTGIEQIYLRVSSSAEFADDPRAKRAAKGVINGYHCDRYITVLLQWAKPRTMERRNRLLAGMFKDCTDKFSMLFIDEFLEQYFGREVLKEFRKSLSTFKSEFQERLGYKITELCSENALNSFKEETENELRTFDYHSQLPAGINSSQVTKLDNNYLIANRVKLMIGTGDFAISFITSEWLYKKFAFSEELDNTYIVAGYLKSVEQLLFDIIMLEGSGRQIKAKGSYTTTVTVDEANVSSIDSTLGSLLRFINQNRELFDVNNPVVGKIHNVIRTWKNDERNGYFHKENLDDVQKVKRIRDNTILIYYLVLGGIDLGAETINLLGYPE